MEDKEIGRVAISVANGPKQEGIRHLAHGGKPARCESSLVFCCLLRVRLSRASAQIFSCHDQEKHVSLIMGESVHGGSLRRVSVSV